MAMGLDGDGMILVRCHFWSIGLRRKQEWLGLRLDKAKNQGGCWCHRISEGAVDLTQLCQWWQDDMARAKASGGRKEKMWERTSKGRLLHMVVQA